METVEFVGGMLDGATMDVDLEAMEVEHEEYEGGFIEFVDHHDHSHVYAVNGNGKATFILSRRVDDEELRKIFPDGQVWGSTERMDPLNPPQKRLDIFNPPDEGVDNTPESDMMDDMQ